jgi:hypothetical protein
MRTNPNEVLVPVRGSLDVNVVGCRDLLARNRVFVIYFGRWHSFHTSTNKAAFAWLIREIRR